MVGATSLFFTVLFGIFALTLEHAASSKTCLRRPSQANPTLRYQEPQEVMFTNVAPALKMMHRQCRVRTSPNCLFDQWDPKMKQWDKGGFCMEETMTGGACVGDVDGDGLEDIYYARMDGSDVLWLNTGDSQFLDGTFVAGLQNNEIRSNGCYIFDLDNDGDNDIYVSTMGNERFYLFINDGYGHFQEEAIVRGLDNSKRDNRMTAGFTITVSDFDLDGDLDVMTTEWFPWLDHVEHEHDQKMKVDGRNATNARLMLNLGPGERLGFFREVTDEAGIRGDIRVRNTITHLIHSACQTIPTNKLREMLQFLEEPVDEAKTDEELHLMFESMVELFKEGFMQTRSMNYTRKSFNPDHYLYLTIPAKFTQAADTIALHLVAHKGKGPVQAFVAGKENPRPTSRKHSYTVKSGVSNDENPINRLIMDVGSAYGMKTLNIGVKCGNVDGCAFDIMFLPVSKAKEDPSVFNCAARRKMEGFANLLKRENFDGSLRNAKNMLKEHRVAGQGVKQVGVFRVDLVSPWISSEVFFEYAVNRMRALHYDIQTVRKEMRKLLVSGKQIDSGREERMVRTERRLKQNVAKKLPGANENNWAEVLQVALDAKRESKNARSKSHQDAFGVRHDDAALQGGLNHAFDLPLVGAFQFATKFADLDMDGYPDLIISGDFGTSQLFYNNGNGTFVHGNFHLVEDMLDNSMGCTVGDWDMDGLLDVMFTSASISENDLDDLNQIATTAGMLLNFRGNHLYKNMGARRFEDVTELVGVRESGWGWGAFLFDFDNDGDLDAFNGNGMDDPETTDDDWAVNQPVKLYVNRGKDENFVMRDEAKLRGIASTQENRGAMTIDYDHDGDLDVLVINHAEPLSLFRNDGGNYYDFLRVMVKETIGSKAIDSVGAKVFLQTDEESENEQIREIGSSAAFLGQGENTAHFGLGLRSDIPLYRVRVLWPSTNTTQEYFSVPVRSILIVYKEETSKSDRGDILETIYDTASYIPECPAYPTTTSLQEEARRARIFKHIGAPVNQSVDHERKEDL